MSNENNWKAIDDLRGQLTQHDRQLAGLEREQKIMRDQYDRLFTTINAIDTKLDLLHVDLSEAKGGLKFGRWLAGILVGILAALAAVAGFIWRP